MSNEEIIKRLLELNESCNCESAGEQKDLLRTLATNVGVTLDGVEQSGEEVNNATNSEDESKQQEEASEQRPASPANERAPSPVKKRAPSPVEEIPTRNPPAAEKRAPEQSVSSARDKFEQPKSDNAGPRKVNTSAESQPQRKGSASRGVAAAPAASSPSANECDISDSNISEAYEKVRDDTSDLNWMLMGYGTSRKVLQLYGSGTGSLKEFLAAVPDNEVVYGYVRMVYGDSGRSKFVFITYIPDSLSGLAKAKGNMHKPSVDQFLKYHHIQVQATSLADMQEPVIQAKLQAAAGANYGTGGVAAAGSEDFGSIKHSARNFFHETEKKGSVQIKYNKDPLSNTTPVSLTGRAGITDKYISNSNLSK